MNIYVTCDLTNKDIFKIKEVAKKHKVFFNDEVDERAPIDKNFLKSEIVFGNVPCHWIYQSKRLK